MRYLSATEAKQGLAAVLDAAQREPVVIRRQQRDVDADEFQRSCDRLGEQAKAHGMTEEEVTEILAGDA